MSESLLPCPLLRLGSKSVTLNHPLPGDPLPAVHEDNALIARLAPSDRLDLLAAAQDVPLPLSQVLWQPGEPLAHVYFPIRGFVSLVATAAVPAGLEVAMIGREGMLGVQAVLGVETTPFRALVQGEGRAWRLTTAAFGQHLADHPGTKQLFDRYATFRLNQLATLAQFLCHHEVGPRLARWLLMSQDRAGSDQFPVTQEALGFMLGVRRVSVSNAATALQRGGVIAYHRGQLRVLDRVALERAACGCYRSDLERYVALFHHIHSRNVHPG
jgi:CRP-like cAMP-binding protein